MRQIADYPLWLGHVGDTRDIAAISSAGIEAVVDLALNERPPTLPRDWLYCRVPLVDGAGNPRWKLDLAIAVVRTLLIGRTPTLLFCGAGMSRTPAIAAAAISAVSGMDLDEALALVTAESARDVSPGLWQDILAIGGESLP